MSYSRIQCEIIHVKQRFNQNSDEIDNWSVTLINQCWVTTTWFPLLYFALPHPIIQDFNFIHIIMVKYIVQYCTICKRVFHLLLIQQWHVFGISIFAVIHLQTKFQSCQLLFWLYLIYHIQYTIYGQYCKFTVICAKVSA